MKRNIVLIVYTCILTVLVGCMWVIVFDIIRAQYYLHEPKGRLTGAGADGTVLPYLLALGTLGLMAIAICIWTMYNNNKPEGVSIRSVECFHYIRKNRWPDMVQREPCYFHQKNVQDFLCVLSWKDNDTQFWLSEKEFKDVSDHYDDWIDSLSGYVFADGSEL